MTMMNSNNNVIEHQGRGDDEEDEEAVGLVYHQYKCSLHELKQKEEIKTDNQHTPITPITTIILLNLVTIIWGTQHSIVKRVIIDDEDSASSSMKDVERNDSFSSDSDIASDTTTDASILIFVRFGLASLIAMTACLLCNCRRNRRYLTDETGRYEEDDNFQWLTWRWGVELGLWMFLGYAFQTIGLQVCSCSGSKYMNFFVHI